MKTNGEQIANSETGQTGQRKGMFEVAQDEDGEWHWCLWTSNGRKIAMNCEGYNQQNDAIQAITALTKTITKGDLKIVIAR